MKMKIKKKLLRLSENPKTVDLGERLYRRTVSLTGEKKADMLLFLASRLFFSSPGLTFIRYGYYNVYSYKFIWAVQERYRQKREGAETVPKLGARSPGEALKIGFVGSLAVPNKDLFQKKPEGIRLFLYDIQNGQGYRAPWLAGAAERYEAVLPYGNCGEFKAAEGWSGYEPVFRGSFSPREELKRLCGKINEDELDLLVYIGGISKFWDAVIGRINSRKIYNYATGSIISFHPKVDADRFMQPQKHYFVKDQRAFCAVLQKNITEIQMKEASFVFNHRGLDKEEPLPWEKREDIIVFHGNLYKLYNKKVLAMIGRLLQEKKTFRFLFLGAEQRKEISGILRFFKRKKLENRVLYMGNFSNMPDRNGIFSGTEWKEMCALIGKAKLYIDAWPVSGGNSVFQAYMLGVPCVSLKLKQDPVPGRIREDETTVEVNGLQLKENTVETPREYEAVCRKILDDGDFAQKLAREQRRRGLHLCGADAVEDFWKELEELALGKGKKNEFSS